MTPEKCTETVALYRQYFVEHNVTPQKFGRDLLTSYSIKPEVRIEHVAAMLDQMDEFIKEGHMEKFFRWLGFVQGVLWSQGRYSIDEMRDHNRG